MDREIFHSPNPNPNERIHMQTQRRGRGACCRRGSQKADEDGRRAEKKGFGAQYTPLHLLPIDLALARWRDRQTLDNEKEAKKRLILSEFKVRMNHLRHGALLYLFELWAGNQG